ncbi:MAG TPA: alpha/beta fold hydrolase [Chloroflexia bacterium]|nr:alpha/beta fold hydrolase [Chloroflexia bacterium]
MAGFFKAGKKTKNTPLHLDIGLEESWEWRGHQIVYSVMGEGAPLLLVHSINAAAWAFEMRLNIEPLAAQYKVYVPDLPGFGRSERKPVRYTAELYIEFMADFARYIKEQDGQAPAVIASSLPAAYVISIAASQPDLLGPLMLVTPIGYNKLDKPAGPKAERVHRWFMGPLGSAVFWLLTTKASQRLFLARDGYYDKSKVTPTLLGGYHVTARQPNAKYAPISFVTQLLNHSVQSEWPALSQPVLLVWGREAIITPVADANLFTGSRPGTELKVFEQTRLAVFDEKANDFNALALEWLGQRHSGLKEPAHRSS